MTHRDERAGGDSTPRGTALPPVAGVAAGVCEWTPTLAECLAQVFGVEQLTERHWRVISECREEWARSGRTPGAGQLASVSHLSVEELAALFPDGQLSLAWILAGVVPPGIPAPAVAAPSGAAEIDSRTRPEARAGSRSRDSLTTQRTKERT